MIYKYLISGRNDGPFYGIGVFHRLAFYCNMIAPIFGILYFKLSLIDAINEFTKHRTI
jgi:hypothetical protein